MEYASRGVGNAGLTTGIIGTALGAMNSGLVGNLFGGTRVVDNCGVHDYAVNRYEATLSARVAELESHNRLLEANIYTDQKLADVYERLNTKVESIEHQICEQAVYNATNNATIGCLSQQIAQLQALTKLGIPRSSICPEVMLRYNTWTAPTETAEAPAAGA